MPRKSALVKREALYAFFLEYVRNGGNGSAAYKRIHPDVSTNTAKARACQIIKNNPEMLDKVRQDLEFANKNKIMDIQARKEWLTDVILQRKDNVVCGIKDRLSALRELNKMDGVTGSDEAKVKVTITPEEQKETYRELLDNQFNVIDGEFDEKEDEAS